MICNNKNCKRMAVAGKKRCEICLSAIRLNVRRWQAENKLFIRDLKNRPCENCGKKFHVYMMEFDHIDPSHKVIPLSNAFRMTRTKILKEAAKCVVLCVGCHRLKTLSLIKTSAVIAKDRAARKRNHEFVDSLKKSPCADCYTLYEPVLMDFDHVRGEKTVAISTACTKKWSFEKILVEVSKCDLVCCWCHRTRTISRLQKNTILNAAS